MPKFKVDFVKRFYQCGSMEIEAENADMAFDKASDSLVDAEFRSKIEWEDMEYEDGSFEVEPEVEEIEE